MFKIIFRILSLLKNFKFVFSGIWSATILYLSLGRINAPKEISLLFPYSDKVAHFGMYLILSTFLLFEQSESTKKNIIARIMLYSILLGILMEILQSALFKYRSGDFVDAVFNTIGSTFALLFYLYFKRTIKI